MKIKNTATNTSFAARTHTKKPAYFDAAEKSVNATINGKQRKLVLHPKKEAGDRVNFVTDDKPTTWYFVDNAAFAEAVRSGKGKFDFVTETGRAAKPAATPEAAKSATAK